MNDRIQRFHWTSTSFGCPQIRLALYRRLFRCCRALRRRSERASLVRASSPPGDRDAGNCRWHPMPRCS
jgi:hypothetical protein